MRHTNLRRQWFDANEFADVAVDVEVAAVTTSKNTRATMRNDQALQKESE
ncbi:hypothetical protein RDWZM_001011 [Blomia tropicalis]|uniref:Uncharacterized protein n=1 Tax=Blomia tropicalis TaxID=40697 RepID=A0A9Q0MAV7_BLOTA|nr:hypothetical protein RDWZM_001011 [Blomia tropicalis]